MSDFSQFIRQAYQEHGNRFSGVHLPEIKEEREKALQDFLQKGLPTKELESWRHYPIDQMVENEYTFQHAPEPYQPIEKHFSCAIKNFASNVFALLNGWYLHHHSPLTIFPNGVIIGSIFAAMEQYPELVLPYCLKSAPQRADSLFSLNKAFANDGVFLYVPDDVIVEQPIQLISLVNTPENMLIQERNLVIVGKNASLSLVHCNDSFLHGKTFVNNVTEIYIEENASLHYHKMGNKDAESLLVDYVSIHQKAHSQLLTNTITLNAGYVRNVVDVNLNEPFAEAKVYGLYLVDKKQIVDNQVFVNHAAADCTSRQLYKGITDDESTANFNGHIYVAKDAQRTAAFQSNRNITLTDEAKIMTKPFLEIYADDVQCSHGATVGQLNDEALFYLMTRGICERNARMLLLHAFANEVIDFVNIESLKHAMMDMIRMRLSGELSPCDQCVMRCSNDETLSFDIDISKI